MNSCGLLKKCKRGDFSLDDPEIAQEVADDVSDVQMYLDILAFRLGVDLGQATVDKFNRVSERVGASTRISCDGQEALVFDPVEGISTLSGDHVFTGRIHPVPYADPAKKCAVCGYYQDLCICTEDVPRAGPLMGADEAKRVLAPGMAADAARINEARQIDAHRAEAMRNDVDAERDAVQNADPYGREYGIGDVLCTYEPGEDEAERKAKANDDLIRLGRSVGK